MCPTGSLPERLGMPPLLRTQRAAFEGEYPWTLMAPRTVSHTARAPRESIHEIAGPMATPLPSIGTVPDHCAVHPIPTTRSAATPLSASARRAHALTAVHHASGDCSAPPSSVNAIPTASKAWATIPPVAATTATLLGPRSRGRRPARTSGPPPPEQSSATE